MNGALVRPEELYSSMPHLTRVLDRGLDQVPAAPRGAAYAGICHDLTRLKHQWQREALTAEREEAPHVPG